MMKKIIVLIALVFFNIVPALSQKTSFGIQLGLTGALLQEKFGGTTGPTQSITNVDPRIYADINYGHITVQPGLALFLKGGWGEAISYSSPNSNVLAATSELKLTYLQIPVNVLYNLPIKTGKFFVGGGPYIAMAVSGKNTAYFTAVNSGGNVTQNKTETSVNFGSGANELQRFDYGFNVLGGFRFNNGLDLGLGYGIGLANITNDSNFIAKNLTFSVTVGYFFK